MTAILIIEDHPDIAKILKLGASTQGYKAFCAPNVLNAYELLRKQSIDLIVLDWMLPGQNGLSFLKDLKAHESYQNIPVIMLTCMGQEEQKIEGLEAGADDYVLKPFSNKELFLRIANILKKQNMIQRKQNKSSEHEMQHTLDTLQTLYFSMDFKNKKIWAINCKKNIESNMTHQNSQNFAADVKADAHENSKAKSSSILLDLSPTEFKLLSILIQYPEQVFSREQLLNKVWKGDSDVQDRTVDVHIKRLRQNIKQQTGSEIHTQAIETVRGFGYRLLNYKI